MLGVGGCEEGVGGGEEGWRWGRGGSGSHKIQLDTIGNIAAGLAEPGC